MSDPAQITVTTGPDRGRVFELADEVMHIGRGPENDIVLSDPSLAEHQASIVSRGGRYAIFSPEEDAVQVDENAIPSDQWVWLPEEARISIGERTVVQFRSAAVLAGPASAAPATGSSSPPPMPADIGSVDPFGDDDPSDGSGATPPPAPGQRKRRKKPRKRKRPEKAGGAEKRKVAQFITDRTGDTVVSLGEDGQLPELQLQDGPGEAKRTKVEQPPREGFSPVVIGLLLFSMLATVAMLFMDFEPGQSSRALRAKRRWELRLLSVGADLPPSDDPRKWDKSRDITTEAALDDWLARNWADSGPPPPEPYQELLRKALLANKSGEYAAERRYYRQVLSLLTAEDRTDINPLTGSADWDERMKNAIAALLSR